MATPSSVAQLNSALAQALPTQYRPCVPAPTRDGKIHISIGYGSSDPVPNPNQPTTSLCGEASVVAGSTVVPDFVICPVCWEDFLDRTAASSSAAASSVN
jgi:hypothetical protein